MEASPDRSERLICAVLAAQVAAIRDRIDNSYTVELLWRTLDLISELSALVLELSQPGSTGDSGRIARCSSVLAVETEISRTLEDVVFQQTQHQDGTRQMVECVMTVLEQMAAEDTEGGSLPSPSDIAALYVSEEQQRVHDAVAQRFGSDASGKPLSEPKADRKPEGADE